MGVIARVLSIVAVSCALATPAGATIPSGRTGMDIRGLLNLVPESRAGEDAGGTVEGAMRAMLSTLVGEAVSRSMDDTDLMMILHTLDSGTAGVASRWRNPRTGSVYSITSRRSYDATGVDCFEYSMEAVNGARRDRVDGIACRQPDGSWTR